VEGPVDRDHTPPVVVDEVVPRVVVVHLAVRAAAGVVRHVRVPAGAVAYLMIVNQTRPKTEAFPECRLVMFAGGAAEVRRSRVRAESNQWWLRSAPRLGGRDRRGGAATRPMAKLRRSARRANRRGRAGDSAAG